MIAGMSARFISRSRTVRWPSGQVLMAVRPGSWLCNPGSWLRAPGSWLRDPLRRTGLPGVGTPQVERLRGQQGHGGLPVTRAGHERAQGPGVRVSGAGDLAERLRVQVPPAAGHGEPGGTWDGRGAADRGT